MGCNVAIIDLHPGRMFFGRLQAGWKKCRRGRVSISCFKACPVLREGRLCQNLNGSEGSVTILGKHPDGGDFTEPVTQATKRAVGAFLALDRELAHARHFPSINWLSSYSGYTVMLEEWFKDNVASDMLSLREKMLKILHEENKLMDIVKLVGEDVLPDDQRVTLEIAKVIKVGFAAGAYHERRLC